MQEVTDPAETLSYCLECEQPREHLVTFDGQRPVLTCLECVVDAAAAELAISSKEPTPSTLPGALVVGALVALVIATLLCDRNRRRP